jgi:hypothetical protein
MTRRPLLLAALLTAACSAATPAVAPREPAPVVVAPDADASATDAPVADAPPPAPVFSLAAPLGEHVGVILAEQPGGTVSLHPESGPDVALSDGERVNFVDDNVGVGGGDATAVVEARGVRGNVPNARVVTEARLQRATTGGAMVFSAVFSCGDFCHGEVWLLHAEGQRTRITQNAGPSVVTAWRPDGARAAAGSGGLWVVTAADGHVETMGDYTAPAYAPDGALFVRGAGADDAVFALTDGAPPRRVFAPAGRVPRANPEVPREDPAPVAFEQEGAVLRATFTRAGNRTVTARAGRDGRAVAAPRARP